MRKRDPIPLESLKEEHQEIIHRMESMTVPWNKNFRVMNLTIFRKTVTAPSITYYGAMEYLSGMVVAGVVDFSIRIMNDTLDVKFFKFRAVEANGTSRYIELTMEKDSVILKDKIYKKILKDHPEYEEEPYHVMRYIDLSLYKGKFSDRGYTRYYAYCVKNKETGLYEWVWIVKAQYRLVYRWKYATYEDPVPDVAIDNDELKRITRKKKISNVNSMNVKNILPLIMEDMNRRWDGITVTELQIIERKKIGSWYLYNVHADTKNSAPFTFLVSFYNGVYHYTSETNQGDTLEEAIYKGLFDSIWSIKLDV